MTLDATTRGVLEQIIDTVVNGTPGLTRLLFTPETRAKLHIHEQNDFLLGMDLGMIQQAFWSNFFTTHGRFPNEQEVSEAGTVILNRIPEIREAIFKTG